MNDQSRRTWFPPGTLVKFNQMGLSEWGSHFQNDLFIVLVFDDLGHDYCEKFISLFNVRFNRVLHYVLSLEVQQV